MIRRQAPDAEIHFERLAVTPEQIPAWDLPTRPTKADTHSKELRRVESSRAVRTQIITRLVEGAVIMTRANEHHRDHRDRGGGTVFVLRLHAPSGQAGRTA